MKKEFFKEITKLGIVRIDTQETYWEIAQSCIKFGIASGGAGAAIGA